MNNLISGFTISKTDRELYVVQYKVENWFKAVHGETSDKDNPPIYIYAECSVNKEQKSNEGYFILELFFEVGNFDSRQFIIGLTFGKKEMCKIEMDREIAEWIERIITNDSFIFEVGDYITRIKLFDEYMEKKNEDGCLEVSVKIDGDLQ